ncbi:hypothetical protein ASG16_025255 [Brevibacillus sp. Leaf182]|nr:hypothetical protein ASG16_025255 [Brevibacillus sp. Leaf182]
MQKAKHALKRPPLKNILKGQLWPRFRFLHGVVQANPQGALESERFLLFPPHHNSIVRKNLLMVRRFSSFFNGRTTAVTP